LRERRLADEQWRGQERSRFRHDLERQIAELESRPENDGRSKAVRLLRKKLDSL
jgi:hypothetical protein